jgi:hypothetical protein
MHGWTKHEEHTEGYCCDESWYSRIVADDFMLGVKPIISTEGGADKVTGYVFGLADKSAKAIKIKPTVKSRTYRLPGEAALAAIRWWKDNKEGFLQR